MYGLIKTHKVGNPARVITSGFSTAMEKLSISVEKVLFDLANDLPSRIRHTGHMLNIVDELNRSNLPSESILVEFDTVNMFPSTDNIFGSKTVFEILESRVNNYPSTQSVIETLELCLLAIILYLIIRIIFKPMAQLKDHTCLALMLT